MRLVVLSLTAFSIFGYASAIAAGNVGGAALTYSAFCASCHGKGGQGDGPKAATLSTAPGKFTDCQGMRRLTDDRIVSIIKNGGAASSLSIEMPAWQSAFSNEQIRALMHYVRDFCPQPAAREQAEASRRH